MLSVITPYPVDSEIGNSVSARRIVARLNSIGIQAEATFEKSPSEKTAGIIAINAWRLRRTILDFRKKHPDSPLIAVLAGSDLYSEKSESETKEMLEAMEVTDALVVSQAGALEAIPDQFKEKCRVITKSVDVTPTLTNRAEKHAHFEVVVLSNLRPEKDPLLVAEAIRLLPSSLPIQVSHYGVHLDPQLLNEARRLTETMASRYQWLGGVSHDDAMQALQNSDVFINSSRFEGGANAVCEALALGTVVLATSIPGNTGLLGADYPGLFPIGGAPQLAELLSKCAVRGTFLKSLQAACAERAPTFAPEREAALWHDLLSELNLVQRVPT